MNRSDGGPPCTWVGIWLHHEPWGRIHLLGADQDEITPLVLDRAGVALGMALLAQQDAEQMSDRAASAVISDLVAGRYGSTTELLGRAHSLGSDLTGGKLAALVVDPVNLPLAADVQRFTERERQQLRLKVRSQLMAVLTQHRCVALLGMEGDRVLAVVSVPGGQVTDSVLGNVAAAMHTITAQLNPALRLVIGASPEAQPDALQRAFEQAKMAVEFGRHGSGQDLYQFGHLGTYPLLLQLAPRPELATFVESELGLLLQHDAASRSVLLPTLQAYLSNACRKADTVRALGVQRRTLYSRLARIERLLGRSLDDQDVRTSLTLALQGLAVLHDRARPRTAEPGGSPPDLSQP